MNSDFNDAIGKEVTEAYTEAFPGEEEFWFKSASQFTRTPGFHRDGVMLSVSSSALSLQFSAILLFIPFHLLLSPASSGLNFE
jgi:hypothetical protein